MKVILKRLLTTACALVLVASLTLTTSCKVSKTVQGEPTVAATPSPSDTGPYGPPQVIGTIKNLAVSESSGLVASRTSPGVYWTHNDSGDGPFIYAMGEKGDSFGVWRVTGAEADDWEDISVGPGPQADKSYLYIGDIGDNDSTRKHIVIYRVLEPTPTLADQQSSKAKPRVTEPAEVIRLRYPDGAHDAEALLVDPKTGKIFIVTKIAMQKPGIYEAVMPLEVGKSNTMKFVGELKIPSPFGGIITGGSVSPDGTRLALCDYFQGYETELPAGSSSFEEIWKQRFVSFNFGKRKQGESIAYRFDGRAVLGTSEGRGAAIFEVVRK